MPVTGNVVARYVYGTRANVPDFILRGGNTYRVISDQLGSPGLAVNIAQATDIPFRADYTAFGVRSLLAGQGDWIPIGFAGGLYEHDTGLVRLARGTTTR